MTLPTPQARPRRLPRVGTFISLERGKEVPMLSYSIRPSNGRGYVMSVPGRGWCPVGGIYRLIPRPLRRVWWAGWWLRGILWDLTH